MGLIILTCTVNLMLLTNYGVLKWNEQSFNLMYKPPILIISPPYFLGEFIVSLRCTIRPRGSCSERSYARVVVCARAVMDLITSIIKIHSIKSIQQPSSQSNLTI